MRGEVRNFFLVIILIILFGAGAYVIQTGCRFDPGGCAVSPFEGCFEGSDRGGIILLLDSSCENRFLSGILTIGSREEIGTFTAYAVEGEVKSEGIAELRGTDPLSPSQENIIILLIAPDDTLSLQINDGPPLGPLSRCADD